MSAQPASRGQLPPRGDPLRLPRSTWLERGLSWEPCRGQTSLKKDRIKRRYMPRRNATTNASRWALNGFTAAVRGKSPERSSLKFPYGVHKNGVLGGRFDDLRDAMASARIAKHERPIAKVANPSNLRGDGPSVDSGRRDDLFSKRPWLRAKDVFSPDDNEQKRRQT